MRWGSSSEKDGDGGSTQGRPLPWEDAGMEKAVHEAVVEEGEHENGSSRHDEALDERDTR